MTQDLPNSETPPAPPRRRLQGFLVEWIAPNVALYGTLFLAIGLYFVMARRSWHWGWRLPISVVVIGGLVFAHRRVSKGQATFLRCDLAIAGWLIGSFLFFGFAGDYRFVRRFSAEAWKAETNKDDVLSRTAMADDLIKNVLAKGMSRAEVAALLGPGDDPFGGSAPSDCYWYIGQGFFDRQYLRLSFGADDRLIDWGISEV